MFQFKLSLLVFDIRLFHKLHSLRVKVLNEILTFASLFFSALQSFFEQLDFLLVVTNLDFETEFEFCISFLHLIDLETQSLTSLFELGFQLLVLLSMEFFDLTDTLGTLFFAYD